MIFLPSGHPRRHKSPSAKKNSFAALKALIPALFLFAGTMVAAPSAHCAQQEPKSPLDMPMPEPLPPIPPLEKTSPAEQNRQAKKRIKASVERMRKIILMHREMRGLKSSGKKSN